MTSVIKNEPAPHGTGWFQKELTRIGGRVPYGFGPHSGEPLLKLVWGQTEKSFDAGKMRIRFFDQDVQPIFHARSFRVTKECLSKIVTWNKAKHARMIEAFNRRDWTTYHALLFAPTEYFLKRYCNYGEYEKLSSTSSFEETARLLPEGWFYYEDMPIVEEIGTRAFYIVQWIPPSRGAREAWENHRFGVAPVIDLYPDEHFVDILGEYPKYGEYSAVFLKIENDNGEVMPNESHLETVRELIGEREKRTENQKKVSTRVRDRARAGREIEDKIYAQHKDIIEAAVHEEGQIIVKGKTARIYKKERRTYWGKARQVIKEKGFVK